MGFILNLLRGASGETPQSLGVVKHRSHKSLPSELHLLLGQRPYLNCLPNPKDVLQDNILLHCLPLPGGQASRQTAVLDQAVRLLTEVRTTDG